MTGLSIRSADTLPADMRERYRLPPDVRYTAFRVHFVDLPSGGRIEGMCRDDALRIAAELATRAYEAVAVCVLSGPVKGLVIMSPLTRIR